MLRSGEAELIASAISDTYTYKRSIYDSAKILAQLFTDPGTFEEDWIRIEPEVRRNLGRKYSGASLKSVPAHLRAQIAGWAFEPSLMDSLYGRLANDSDKEVTSIYHLSPLIRNELAHIFGPHSGGRPESPPEGRAIRYLERILGRVPRRLRLDTLESIRDWIDAEIRREMNGVK